MADEYLAIRGIAMYKKLLYANPLICELKISHVVIIIIINIIIIIIITTTTVQAIYLHICTIWSVIPLVY